MEESKIYRRPLHDVSNELIPIDQTTNLKQQKRRKLSTTTYLSSSKNTMASIIETMNSNSKVQMDDLIQLKQDKQNDLYNLNGEIWKVQTQIPDLELKIEKLNSKLQIVKTKFQSLENNIENLNIVKNHKIKSLHDSMEIFKSTIDKSFNEKLVKLSQTYEDKVTNIINSNHSKFKEEEKIISDKIIILKKSLEDYSQKHLDKAKSDCEATLKSEIQDLKIIHEEKIKSIDEEIQYLNKKIITLNEEIAQLEVQQLNNSQIINNSLNLTLQDLNESLVKVTSEELALKSQLNTLSNSKDEECNKLLALKEECRQYNHDIEIYNQQIKDEETYRRFLHNKLQEMKGNIRVFCRIKPEYENIFNHQIQSMSCTDGLKESLIISEPKVIQNSKTSSSPIKKSLKSYTFSFDKIFDENSSNGDIFEEISQLVQSSLDGFNVCIFTYGQTGSGKTFTMSNPNDGMIPRSMSQMFEKIEMLSSSIGKDYQLYGQFFEIYGDDVRDLVGIYGDELNDDEVIKPDSDINDIKMIKLTSIEQIQQLLDHATKKRATAATMANDVSSRSHSIFKVHISSYSKELSKYNIIGSLNLVDLAGSERLAHSQVTGIRLKETLAINKSLSSLGDVIASLKSKSSHIPYRNSKLTYILKDSLGGDSKTLMFVNICCLNSHFNETLSSLRFASKVNNTALK
ncbi:kinesin-like nuclear fusion protein [Pichia californica]|uniref:Kinesin-like protein n=1 Tax=Pichia californica TaxID=460514 RepID=A0A9P7BDX7_9ASCO|nr:kinesin-like nuclear fusion protein [[Candida] californica]KAG0687316.1 kinesin-like nuclear fusion protein [[Candida] californica]